MATPFSSAAVEPEITISSFETATSDTSIRRYQPASAAVPVARMEVARLRRFLDNLLDMVRIDAGALPLNLEPIDLSTRWAGRCTI